MVQMLQQNVKVSGTKAWKYTIQRVLFIFAVFYTLFYVWLMNGLSVTIHSHKTSINIRLNQFQEWSRDQEAQRGEQMEFPVEISSKQLPADVQTKESKELFHAADEEKEYHLSYLDNETYDPSSDAHYDEEEYELLFDEQNNQSEESVAGKKRYQPFAYDHPVLRRIEDIKVFYISAIAEEKNLPASSPDGGLNNSKLVLQKYKNGSDDLSFDTPYNKINWIKSAAFLQPLPLYSNESWYGTVTLNGWELYKYAKHRYFCCYRYDDSDDASNATENTNKDIKIKETRNKKINRRRKSKHKQRHENAVNNTAPQAASLMWKNIWNEHNLKVLKATQFVCPLIPNDYGSNILPTKIALSDKEYCKTKKTLKYINIERQLPKLRDSIAVCPKLIYGNYSSERLIEWFEFNKLMGVDKIMLYVYNVVKDVKVVLDHYEKEGLLITREFDIPAKTRVRRKPGGKNTMSFQDEQVTVYDCTERFNNYRFVIILDLDEFLVPKEATHWRSMLSKLLSSHPNASGFVFHTQIFTFDWGISNPSGKLFVTKYIKRTKTMWDRRKNIIIPKRIQRGMVWTHSYTGTKGYISIKVSSQIANIFHYRKCRPQWVQHNTCMRGRTQFTDTTMLAVTERIEKIILEVKNKLLKRYIQCFIDFV